MKVIVAGMPKTGTKTMQAALQELGFTVYDLLEHFQYLEKDWLKIFNEGGKTEDFRRMYEDVDAVTDIPACYFWDEIHKAFPEAKIILTIRHDEKAWCESLRRQLIKNDIFFLTLLSTVTPTIRRFRHYGELMFRGIFGTQAVYSFFKSYSPNMLPFLMTYRRHNSHVLQNAPKDKLLVFDVKEGWDPLCKFLGVEIPNKPFPHKNKNAELTDVAIRSHPVFLQAKKELLFSTCCLSALLLFGSFQIMRNRSFVWHCTNKMLLFLAKFRM